MGLLRKELDDVHQKLTETTQNYTKQVNGLNDELARTKTTEAKDGHKLAAMHKVVSDKDQLIKQINAANAKFEDDLAASAVHLKEIQRDVGKSRKEVADAIKDVAESKAELTELRTQQKKENEAHKAEMQQSLVQVQTKAEARISDLEQSLAEQKKQTSAQEKRLFDDDRAIASLKADIATEQKEVASKEAAEKAAEDHLEEDEEKLKALEA